MTDTVRMAGRGLLVLALAIASFSFVLGMPWHDYGVWRENELPGMAIHLSAGLSALALTLLVASGDRSATGSVTSKPLLLLAALGVLSAALAPFTPSPWQSFHGIMKHGIGALWHVELAVLAASAMTLLRTRFAWAAIAVTAASAIAMMALAAWPQPFGKAVTFDEWLGLLGGLMALAVIMFPRGSREIRWIAGLTFLAAGLEVSGNRTLGLAAFAALGAYGAVLLAPRMVTPARAAALAVAVSLGGLAALYAAAPVIEASRAAEAEAARAARAASDDPFDRIALQSGTFGTVWSRSYMVRAVAMEFAANPMALLTGNGWGSFSRIADTYVRDVPGRMTRLQHPGASTTYWDAQAKADFHPHNVPAEALSAAGIGGLVLWLGFLAALARGSKPGFVTAVALATAGTLWFPMLQLTPALALALAVSARPGRVRGRSARALRDVAPLPGAMLASASFASAFIAWNVASAMLQERDFHGVAVDRDPATCTAFQAGFVDEAEANMYLYRILVGRIERAADPATYLFNHGTNVISLSCALRSHSEERLNIASMLESLSGRERMLAAAGNVALGFLAEEIVAWPRDIERVLEAAPSRTGLAIPYVKFLRGRDMDAAAAAAAGYADRFGEDDPVREWMLAVVMEAQGIDEMRDEHMRRAIRLGLANLRYVAPDDLSLLED